MTVTVDFPLHGIFFDMDGTLLDSEPLTDAVILDLLAEHGLPRPDYSLSRFHGVTWKRVAASLVSDYPSLAGEPLIGRFQSEFHRLLTTRMPPLIAGANHAFTTASKCCTTGVVSSSQRMTIEVVVAGVVAVPMFF